MKEITEQEMLLRMAAYCSAAERCIQDVKKKLDSRGFDDKISSRIILRLLQERFIDEKRYACAFVNDKFRFNRWGKYKIRCELYRKGISNDIIDESLANLPEEDCKNTLLDLLKTKIKSVKAKDNRELYYKLMRFAVGRGFTPEDVSYSLKIILQDVDECEEDLE